MASFAFRVDTELIVSRGGSQADPSGTSSGVVATGRDGKTEITATSTGKGQSNQTTTRVLTSVAPRELETNEDEGQSIFGR